MTVPVDKIRRAITDSARSGWPNGGALYNSEFGIHGCLIRMAGVSSAEIDGRIFSTGLEPKIHIDGRQSGRLLSAGEPTV